MNEQLIQSIIEEVLSRLYVNEIEQKVPIAVSARHCHLCKEDVEKLFGKGYELTKRVSLSQPEQFAAEETVTIVGPRGSIERVRVLGPARSITQVEVSSTDSIRLGLKPPIRQSGDIKGSSPITIVGPKGSIYLKEGLIIAQAHIHMNPEDAKRFRVSNGDYVSVKVEGDRPITFDRVLIRVSSRYKLEMHIDTDEANAGAILSSGAGILMKQEATNYQTGKKEEPNFSPAEDYLFEGRLLTQREIQDTNMKVINVRKSTIVTPLARDTARDLGKVIKVVD